MPVTNIMTTTRARTMPSKSLSDIPDSWRAAQKTRRSEENGTANRPHARPVGVSDSAPESDGRTEARSGPRFVGFLYVALVCVSGVAGFLVGTFVEDLRPPRFLFLVPFPPTPAGFAAYGALTVALVLGVPLLLVVVVSTRIDDAA
jgi:hypothetical protein